MSVRTDNVESAPKQTAPSGWPMVRLGDCCKIVSGGTPKSSEASYWDGDILWATPKDLTELDTKHISATPRTITASGYNKSSANMLPAESVLFSSRAPIGHVAINTVPMCTNQGFKSFVPDTTKVVAEYLYYWLRANKARLQALGNGATFKEVSKAVIAKVEVPLPPLPEQRRIAAILDKADALRQKRREAIAKLDQLLQSVFLEMFGDRIHDPRGWPVEQLKDAYWFQEGPGVRKWQFRSEGIKLLNVSNIIVDGSLDLTKTDRCLSPREVKEKYEHFLCDEGDFVIASSGITFDSDGLLRTRGAFVQSADLPLCMNTSTIRFKPGIGGASLSFLRHWIDSYDFRRQITREVTGSAQKNFGPTHLKKLKIALPPEEEQLAFERVARRIDAQRANFHEGLIKFEVLFSALQQKAFVGNLER